VTRTALALLCALLLVVPAACGDDDQGSDGAGTTPSATSPQGSDEPGGNDGGAATGPGEDPSSPEDRRLGRELQDRLEQGAEGADVESVDVSRTSVTVRTSLDRDAAEAASTICAEMRRYLAQEPSSNSAATVTVVGGGDAVITRC
jgi:hypothetical protein